MKMRMNYRNHRKIIVVDGLTGFVGGINVGDEYIGKHPRLGFWRDTHLRLEGDSVYWLQVRPRIRHPATSDWVNMLYL
jgi:cardiolipin synthase